MLGNKNEFKLKENAIKNFIGRWKGKSNIIDKKYKIKGNILKQL